MTDTRDETKTLEKSISNENLRFNEYYNLQKELDELFEQSKSGKIFKNLIPLITDDRNIEMAFKRIRANHGSYTPGVDGKTIEFFKMMKPNEYTEYIRKQINNYHPKAVKRVYIPKSNGDKRPLGIPTITDRIVQQCILQVMEPICEAKFHPHSYGFRPMRAASHAVSRCASLINIQKQYHCVDIDIKGFFDNVDHATLKKQIWSLGIRDKNLIKIIGKILGAEIDGIGIPDKGTPQGGILSPLLSNIVLNELDWWIDSQWQSFKTKTEFKSKHNNPKYMSLRNHSNLKEMYIVRYADDFKIFTRSNSVAIKIKYATIEWLKCRLHLDVNQDKSSVTNLRRQSTEFLGFTIGARPKNTTRGNWVAITRMSSKSRERVTKELRCRIKAISKEVTPQNVMRYNAFVRGVHNYYGIATHITNDFGQIFMKTRGMFYNCILEEHNGRGTPGIGELYKSTFLKEYGTYVNNPQIANVCNITLIPIAAKKHQNPMNFSQVRTPYSEIGRTNFKTSDKELLSRAYHIMENVKYENLELNSFRVSLFLKQKGLCYVTGEELLVSQMEMHHMKPKKYGGKDEFKNLCYISYYVHKLIHAKEDDIIKLYLKLVAPNEKQLVKINKLRNLAKNTEIPS